MAPLGVVLLIFVLSPAARLCSAGTWCTCREGLPDSMLQKTLDYACGAGADCVPIHQKGPCFQPNTVRAHCSYAVNSFFQRKGQAQGTCDFDGTAKCSSTDPNLFFCSNRPHRDHNPVDGNTYYDLATLLAHSLRAPGATSATPAPAKKSPPTTTTSPTSTNTPGNPYTTASPGMNPYSNQGGFRPVSNAMPSVVYLLLSGSVLFWA